MGFVQIGFLSALGALAVPIIIHLVFGRRAGRVDLGTLRFLRVVLSETVRRQRIKRWLLLALRMSCFALLAFLFARPYLRATPWDCKDQLAIALPDQSAHTARGRDRRPVQPKSVAGRCPVNVNGLLVPAAARRAARLRRGAWASRDSSSRSVSRADAATSSTPVARPFRYRRQAGARY
jgi:hypothetical protein